MRASLRMLLLGSLLAAAAPAWGQAQFDACALLARAEIQAVQGEAVTAVKSSRPPRAGAAVFQCFFTVAPFEKSVSLEVTRQLSPAAAASGPRQSWNRLFHPQKNSGAGRALQPKATAEKNKKNGGPPRRVRGVGDEAFWVGDQVIGVLYVLTGDAYFRISVGGWADEKLRRQKTVALARKIAKRLSFPAS